MWNFLLTLRYVSLDTAVFELLKTRRAAATSVASLHLFHHNFGQHRAMTRAKNES